jgi:hypothetical protein
METTTPPPPTDPRFVAEQLGTGPQVTFATQGRRLETQGVTLIAQAYVEMSPVRTESVRMKTAVRLIDWLRGWAA